LWRAFGVFVVLAFAGFALSSCDDGAAAHDCGRYHVWNEWVTVFVDCETPVDRTRTCRHCGEIDRERFPVPWHDWGVGWEGIAPDCTTPGVKTRACVREGCTVRETEYLDALGHDWDIWIPRPAVGFPGRISKRRDCRNCDYYQTRSPGELHCGCVEDCCMVFEDCNVGDCHDAEGCNPALCIPAG